MIILQHGDRLPTVAGVQVLLNGRLPNRTPLVVDGIFGDNTEAAVRYFQQEILHSSPTGRINGEVWGSLSEGQDLLVRDLVDISDPLIHEMADVVRAEGSRPILRGGASNATSEVVPSIAASGVSPGTLFLLRFQGHGNRGTQVVGYGTGCVVYYDVMRRQPVPSLQECIAARRSVSPRELGTVGLAMSRSNISLESLELPEIHASLAPLKHLLSVYGSVEFHGCQVGGGIRGAQFLQRVANLFDAPCTAARTRQLTTNAIRFRGPILTKFPGRVNALDRWAAGLPVLTSTRPSRG